MRYQGSEAQVLDRLEEQLAGMLPWGDTKLRLEPGPTRGSGEVDAIVELPTPVGSARLVIEIKNQLTPASGRVAAAQAQRYAEALGANGALVVAPWLSPATRRQLTAAGVSWADVTGNMRLHLDDPPLLVATQGADRNPAPAPRGTRGLGGGRAAEVVRALAELAPPFTLSELVTAIGTIDPTYVSRILRGLAEAGLIDREPRGPVTSVDVVGVVERWVDDYGVLEDNLPRRYMLLGGPLQLLERVRALPPPRRRELRLALTGSLVAYQVAPVAEPVTAMAYTTAPEQAATELGLVDADGGANVLLLVPGNPDVVAHTWHLEGAEVVAPAVAAADLLSMGGRGVDEATALLDWALRNPERWRPPCETPARPS